MSSENKKSIFVSPYSGGYSNIIRISPITDRNFPLIPPCWAERAFSGDGCNLSYICFHPKQKWNVQYYKRGYDGREVWLVERPGIKLHMDKEEFGYTFGEIEVIMLERSES